MQYQAPNEGNNRYRGRTTSVDSQDDKENVVWESEMGRNRKSTTPNVLTSRLNVRRSNPSFPLVGSKDVLASSFLPFKEDFSIGRQFHEGHIEASDIGTFTGGNSGMVASNSNSSMTVNATSTGSNSTIDISSLPTVPSFEARQNLYHSSEVEVLQEPELTQWESRRSAFSYVPTSSLNNTTSPTTENTNAVSLRSIWDPKMDEIVPFVPMSRTRSFDDPFAPSPNDPLYVSSKNLKDLENLSGRNQRSAPWKSAASKIGGRTNDHGGAGNDVRDGDWLCKVCGYHNFRKNDECMKCLSPISPLAHSPYLSSASHPNASRIASDQSSKAYSNPYGDSQPSALDPSQQHQIDLETQLLCPYTGTLPSLPMISLVPSKGLSNQGHSQLTILAKLAAHIEALCMLGRQGEDLKRILVEGDLGMGLAMGMRGLVGKEAVNPWKVMGVEIPSQQFGKFGPKPALGSVAGDWQCLCGRENWAKRSVCSRCFPGIEPEWKSTVLSYIQPILQLVDGQQQLIDTHRDLQRVNEEEKRLRKEQVQQQHTGPTFGRKYVAEPARSSKHSSRHQEHLPSSEMLRLAAMAGGIGYPSLDGRGVFIPTDQIHMENLTSTRGPRFRAQPIAYSHLHIAHKIDDGRIVESDSEDSFSPFSSSGLSQLPTAHWTDYAGKQSSAEEVQSRKIPGHGQGSNQPFVFPFPNSTGMITNDNDSNQISQPTTKQMGNAPNSRNPRTVSPIGHGRPSSKASSNASGNNLDSSVEDEEGWPDLVSRFHGSLGGFGF